jgi:hypothetical protein
MLLYIIYTESAMYLSKAAYPFWRGVQDEFCDYKASLGPWEVDAVTEYLQNDHPEVVSSAGIPVAELVRSEHVLRQLRFSV